MGSLKTLICQTQVASQLSKPKTTITTPTTMTSQSSWLISFVHFIAIAVCCAFPWTAALAEQSTQDATDKASQTPSPTYKTYFTAAATDSIPDNQPATEFACTDTIYAVVEAQHLPFDEELELFIVWKEPSGDISEETRYVFYAFEQETRLWAWLRLSRGAGGNLLSLIDSAAGMHSFIGEWKVELFVNQQSIGEGRFDVVC